MENWPRKRTPPSKAVSLAPAMRQVALAIVELELHLMLPLTWRASYRGVETTISMLFELVSEYMFYGDSSGLKNTRIMQRRCNSLS
jgi:hypothetical protein